MTTVSAAVRVMPWPPARVLRRNTGGGGGGGGEGGSKIVMYTCALLSKHRHLIDGQ